MTPIYAAAIVVAFIALGELVSIWSRARVPGLLVAMLGAFVFAQLGLIPDSVVDESMLTQVYAILVAPLLFHMGSLIPLRTMMQQWRSVIIACSGMATAVALLAATIVPMFGFEHFVAGAGPLAGGIVATGLTTEGLISAGVASSLIVLPALVLMVQSLPAMPVTNLLLRRYARGLVESGELEKLAARASEPSGSTRRKLVRMPSYLADNQLFVLFLILVGGSIATVLEGLTSVPSSILALLLGIGSTAVGLTPERAMEKASSFGIAMAGVVAIVMAPLLTASMADVLTALAPMVAILLIGGLGIAIGGFLATRALGWKPSLGVPVALTAMYGFPADYLLTNEVARSVGRDAAEREQLTDAMLPAMLVGGFTSVSAGSVAIASILVSFLG